MAERFGWQPWDLKRLTPAELMAGLRHLEGGE
jgi:hypothetical protein